MTVRELCRAFFSPLQEKDLRFNARAISCACLLLLSSCSRNTGSSVQRLAILPANVLIADASSEWMRLAVPLVLSLDLSTSRNVIASVATSESAVYQLGSTATLRSTVEEQSGRLDLRAAIAETATQQNRQILTVAGTASSLASQLDELAKRIDGQATQFSTHNERALESFALSISSSGPQKLQHLKDAIGSDPSFGLAYVALADSLAETNNPEVNGVLENAESHRASFTPLDKARFELLRSRLSQAPLSDQATAGAALVKMLPNDPEALSALASSLFLQGRGADAERFMNRAIQISPENANLRQKLAAELVETGQFAQAEKVWQSLAANPGVLPQLAACILLEGDSQRANDTFEKFLAPVANPDAKALLGASWQALSGHREAAIRQLTSARFNDPRVGAFAQNQLVLWLLMDKNYQGAKQMAPTGPLAELLAAGAPSAEAWEAKVKTFPDKKARAALEAYGLFLHGFYPQAAEAWQQIEQRSGGTDLPARAMEAASLRLAGRTEDARKIRVQPFLPDFNNFYAAVSFSQLRSLLGQAG